MTKWILTGIMLFYITVLVNAQAVQFKGQLSSWITTKPEESFSTQIGIRYLPEINFSQKIKEKYTLDAELSLNLFGYGYFYHWDSSSWDGSIKPYRIWVRFAGPRYEIRAGLQKISFGSAAMLRPLMWFDQIDPRDPLQITNGVYSLLGRYYLKNNANLWFWFLYGNDEVKGWEVIPSFRKKPEIGGRVQVPFLQGEVGGSYHFRTANLAGVGLPVFDPDTLLDTTVPENRLGLDGKWDLGIGLWMEAAFILQDNEISNLRKSRLINLGADYTFPVGNGLTATTEQFWYGTSGKWFDNGDALFFSSLSVNYPLSIIDNLTAIFYIDWTNHSVYNFINWGMRWDKISLYIMGYWNPETYQIYNSANRDMSLYTGRGLMVQFVYNH